MYSISRYYSDSLIFEVVFRVMSGELNANQARLLYNIGGKMTIYRWLDLYGFEMGKRGGYQMVKKQKTPASQDRSPALEEAQLRLEYYETLFALANDEYGMDIKKLLGTSYKNTIKQKIDNKPLPNDRQKPPSLL